MAIGSGGQDLRLDVAVNAREAIAAANALAAAMQGLAGSAGTAAAATVGAAEAQAVQATALQRAQGAWTTLRQNWLLVTGIAGGVAAAIYKTSEALDRQQSMMQASRADVGRLVEATHGLISTSDLLVASNRLMNSEFNVGQRSMETYARAAWNLAEASGRSWQEAMDAIAGAVMGQTRGLKTFGYSAANVVDAIRQIENIAASAEPQAESLAESFDQLGNAAKDYAAAGIRAAADSLGDFISAATGGLPVIEGLANHLRFVADKHSVDQLTRFRANLAEVEAIISRHETGGLFTKTDLALGRLFGNDSLPVLREKAALYREQIQRLEDYRAAVADDENTARMQAQWRSKLGPLTEAEEGQLRRRGRGGGRARPGAAPERPGMDRDADEVMELVGANERLGASLEGLMMQAGGAAAALDLERETMASVNAETRAANELLERRKQNIEELARVTDIGAVASSALESGIVGMFEALRSGENVGKAFSKMVGMQFWAAGASGFAKSTLQLIEAILISANIFKGGPAAAASLYASAGKGFAMSAGLIAVGAGLGYSGGAFSGGGGGGGGGYGSGLGSTPGVGGGGGGSEPQVININLGTNNVITSDPASLARAFRRILSDGADSEPGMSTTSSSGHRVLTLAP